MSKKHIYMTVDTETATLPFADLICKGSKQKQKVAIAKPLVYDIGWVLSDRQGNILKKENFLVSEIFYCMPVFNTAYYKSKRPLYIEMKNRGEIKVASWNDIMLLFMADMQKVKAVTAFNCCFDFKKAIPFTEKYIKKINDVDYQKWEDSQKRKCLDIIQGKDSSKNPKYLEPIFEFRGMEVPLFDLWGVACERLINIDRYRNYCLETSQLTASAQYFKSGAETCFQYLLKKHDFIEDHTALSDALIEAEILTKALKKGKIEPDIKPFPFRKLGTTYNYVTQKKPKYKKLLRHALDDYIDQNNGVLLAEDNSYWKRVINMRENL